MAILQKQAPIKNGLKNEGNTKKQTQHKGKEELKIECSLTSGIPEPHAYGAKALTSMTARKEKSRAQKMYIM